jgi:hypothetical protein
MKRVKSKQLFKIISKYYQAQKKKHTFSAPISFVEIKITPTLGPQCRSSYHSFQIVCAHRIRIFAMAGDIYSVHLSDCSSGSKHIMHEFFLPKILYLPEWEPSTVCSSSSYD